MYLLGIYEYWRIFMYLNPVCNLFMWTHQGVGDSWTDPQIHSVDQRGYGKGNMGMRGIRAFLNNHR